MKKILGMAVLLALAVAPPIAGCAAMKADPGAAIGAGVAAGLPGAAAFGADVMRTVADGGTDWADYFADAVDALKTVLDVNRAEQQLGQAEPVKPTAAIDDRAMAARAERFRVARALLERRRKAIVGGRP